jgi:hypothetical protein
MRATLNPRRRSKRKSMELSRAIWREQAARLSRSANRRTLPNPLFRNNLHISNLDPIFYEHQVGYGSAKYFVFNNLRNLKKKLHAAGSRIAVLNSLFCNILRVSYLDAIFYED